MNALLPRILASVRKHIAPDLIFLAKAELFLDLFPLAKASGNSKSGNSKSGNWVAIQKGQFRKGNSERVASQLAY